MKPKDVAARLPEFTPALLDVAGRAGEEAGHLQAASFTPESNLERLGLLETTLDVDWWAGDPNRHIHRALRHSLGALVRLTQHIPSHQEASVGRAVKRMAKTAIAETVRVKTAYNHGPYEGSNRYKSKKQFLNKGSVDERHVVRHAESYRTLRPLMGRRLRRRIDKVL